MPDIITKIKLGDEEAFEFVYKTNSSKVFAYFLKKTASEEDARDLMQNVFLRLWKYRKSLNEAFLIEQHIFHIARSVLVSYIRKENTIAGYKKTENNQVLPVEEAHSTVFDLQQKLQHILNEMPPVRKEVFILTRLSGCTYKQVSELLSISVKSVDNHVAKALRQIRAKLLLAIVLFICSF